MNTLGKLFAYGALIATLGTAGFVAEEYADYPWPFTDKTEMGRTKNAISTVIAGAVAKELYLKNDNLIDIRLAVEKSFWPDAHVWGFITPDQVRAQISDLTFTSVDYAADRNKEGVLEGNVKKSEFDWDVKQNVPNGNSYHVSRFLFKFDSDLQIDAYQGNISGTYVRHGPAFNWNISGKYDSLGNVHVDVSVPLGLDFSLDGKIVPAKADK